MGHAGTSSGRKRRAAELCDTLSVVDLFAVPGKDCAEITTVTLRFHNSSPLYFSKDLLMLHSTVFRGMFEETVAGEASVELDEDKELMALALKLLFDAAKCRPFDERQFRGLNVGENHFEVDFRDQCWTPQQVASREYPLREFIALCDKFAFKWILNKLDTMLSDRITEPQLLKTRATRAQYVDEFLKLAVLALEYNMPSLAQNIKLKVRGSTNAAFSSSDETKVVTAVEQALDSARDPYSVVWGLA